MKIMSNLFVRNVALASVLLPLCSLALAADDSRGMKVVYAEKRVALVIGNGAYAAGPLANAANDATDMADVLGRRKFEVTLLTNADKSRMETAIEEFGKSLHQGGVGLFYYAGHAMQIEGVNYLIPVAARINKEGDVKHQAVDVGLVLTEMEGSRNRLNVVILDSCRDNPFARSDRSAASGLARMDAPSGTLIAYSTAPGKTAADGSGRNAVYTGSMLKYMDTPGLEVGSMFKRVRSEVETVTEGRQTPWESTSVKGDFFFTPIDVLDEKLNLTAEQLARYQQLLAEQKQSEQKLQTMESEKTASIERMNREIKGLQDKLNQPGAADGTLDQMLAMVDTRKQYREDLAAAKAKAEEEQRQREQEIARLKAQDVANRKKAFEADYEKYKRLSAAVKEGLLSEVELAAAWKTLCANWKVADQGKKPGILLWNDAKSCAESGRQTGVELAVDLGNDVKMEFLWIKALNGWVGKYEVTNEEYRRFNADHTSGEYESQSLNGDRQPVVQVSYDDAVAFAAWINSRAALPEGYKARLPDGKEWLTFAQCGDGREYPWGSEWPPKYGNYHGQEGAGSWTKIDGYNDGHPVACDVGQSGINTWGLYGVGGNVWEWTSELYDSASGARVLRGASWGSLNPGVLRCSFRFYIVPSNRDYIIGFRLVVLR